MAAGARINHRQPARPSRAGAMANDQAPAGAKATAAATIAAADAWPDFSDGNLGPDSKDDNLGPDSTGSKGAPKGAQGSPKGLYDSQENLTLVSPRALMA